MAIGQIDGRQTCLVTGDRRASASTARSVTPWVAVVGDRRAEPAAGRATVRGDRRGRQPVCNSSERTLSSQPRSGVCRARLFPGAVTTASTSSSTTRALFLPPPGERRGVE